MPLNLPSLESALEDLFAEPPLTAAECAAAWADALEGYATGVVPTSTTVASGNATLASSLEAAFGAEGGAAPGFDAALLAFATTIAAGMLPLYTGVPPAAPLGIATMLAASQPTHEAAAQAFAAHLDAWFRTGSATLVAPPNTPAVWS